MAIKYGPRKQSNAGTSRKSTSSRGGSRTRTTQTTKFGNVTKSRSVNRNGTIRQTTTHKSPSGWITRSVKTVGSAPSKPKAPKFIKAKPFKAPKIRIPKSTTRSYSGGGRRRSRGGQGDAGGELFLILFALTIGAIWWVTKHLAIATWIILREFTVGLWGAAGLAVKQEEKNFKWYCKAAGYFVLYLWVIAVLIYWPMKYLLSDKTKEEVKPIPVVEIQEEKIEMPELNVIIPAIIESQQKE